MGSAIWTEAGASEPGMETEVSSHENEYAYLAVLSRPDDFLIWDFIERNADTIGLDESRAVHAALFSAVTFSALILPEGSDAEEVNSKVGARLTFDKPFDTFLHDNGLEGLQVPPGIILEPNRVEIVGNFRYGAIVEMGDDYVILDEYNKDARPSGNLIRGVITPDTLQMWTGFGLPFQPGSGCEVIVDKDGAVLAMNAANG